jgi:hypothetical protein
LLAKNVPNQAQEAGGRKAKAEVYDERLSKRGLFSFTPITATLARYKSILLLGTRQAGKSTLVKHVCSPELVHNLVIPCPAATICKHKKQSRF